MDYLEEYMIDSTVVAPDGIFAFSLRVQEWELVMIAKTKRAPGSYTTLIPTEIPPKNLIFKTASEDIIMKGQH